MRFRSSVLEDLFFNLLSDPEGAVPYFVQKGNEAKFYFLRFNNLSAQYKCYQRNQL